MKIVYLYPQYAHRAGTERILIDKMNYLAGQPGYEVVMLTFEQGTHSVAYKLSPQVKHVDLGVCYYPWYRRSRMVRFYKWSQLSRLLRQRYDAFMAEYRPDIVVVTTYYAEILELVTRCPTPSVRIMESHIDKRFILSNDPVNRKSLLRWLHMLYDMRRVERAARHFDLLVALKQADADSWSRYVKTVVISNVVHLNSKGRYSEQTSHRVIFVGRYTEQKGIPELFQMWRLVYERHPDWHLDLYGEGDMQAWMEREVARHPANIHIHEPHPHIFDCYRESSIFVLTSVYEPFGLVMPEAMSCGLPVVSFDCPSGPADIITDGKDGFLIPDRNVRQFAERVCQLIDDEELRRRMGRAAVASAQRFSADRIMPQWKELFEHLVEAG